MRIKRLIAVSIPVLAVIAAVLTRIFTARLRPDLGANEVTLLTVSAVMAVMYIGCASLFLMGLANFTPRLKLAYMVFCVALILFALSELQVPAGTLMGEVGKRWLNSGLMLGPLLLSIGGMYAGVRLFAKLFSIKSIWANPWIVTGFAIVAAVGAFFLPVGEPINTVEEAKGSNSLITMMLVLFIASTILVSYIRWQVTEAYRNAMDWFFWALMSFVVAAVITLGATTMLGTKHWFVANGFSLLLQGIFALILLKAAYEFNALGSREAADDEPVARATIVDIVVAAGQKASTMAAIDPLLDNVRMVTAHLSPGQRPTPSDEATLMHTYQQIEQYLVTADPVRRYTKDELRQLIRKELHLTGPVFFDTL